ncbi:MAG: hypothetical protein QNK03_19725 [Myxococcota bacterium]|nr:hypothetical protein [Myxococcota bacterium]
MSTPRDRSTALLALAAAGVTLLLVGLVVVGIAIEVGLRLHSGRPFEAPAKRFAGLPLELIGSPYPATYDERLGYVPEPGARGWSNVWGTKVTIDPDGLRSNGSAPPEGVPLLAIGDSLTFGDEVDDDETWPAHLERLVGRPVVNGGVFGYGLDQMVLRAEQLIGSVPADLMIVSMIGDSAVRCEFSYRYAWKPYFELDDGSLRLRNVPVPPPDTPWGEMPAFEQLLRKSHLADFVGSRVAPDRWLIPESIRVHRQGPAIARLLVERLVELTRAHDVQLVLVLQWFPRADNRPVGPALRRAQELGIPVLALRPHLLSQLPPGPGGQRDFRRFFHVIEGAAGHMSARGNEEVAIWIAGALVERGLLAALAPR